MLTFYFTAIKQGLVLEGVSFGILIKMSQVKFLFLKHAEKLASCSSLHTGLESLCRKYREVGTVQLLGTRSLQLESVFYFLTPVNTCLQVKT